VSLFAVDFLSEAVTARPGAIRCPAAQTGMARFPAQELRPRRGIAAATLQKNFGSEVWNRDTGADPF
jgi:hypothetical protein